MGGLLRMLVVAAVLVSGAPAAHSGSRTTGKLRVTRHLPTLKAVVVAASTVGARPVTRYVSAQPESTEPAVRDQYWVGVPYEWQFTSTNSQLVPEAIQRAAARIKIAVVDTGCDTRQPDLAAKSPQVYSAVNAV